MGSLWAIEWSYSSKEELKERVELDNVDLERSSVFFLVTVLLCVCICFFGCPESYLHCHAYPFGIININTKKKCADPSVPRFFLFVQKKHKHD